ncbi:MAG TPA: hypothetical protein VFP52_11495, partial [Myxococcales bacterium]|nr:hypothetical protein [Myxococcales bacterium]
PLARRCGSWGLLQEPDAQRHAAQDVAHVVCRGFCELADPIRRLSSGRYDLGLTPHVFRIIVRVE